MVQGLQSDENTRRLMAIMFTDIKGYSSMMGADEAATVELVLEHRHIMRAAIADHEGHEHETIGDAFVVLFESVVNAVRCAIDVQQRLADRNAPLPEERQVWIRVGVHLGDIILRDGGIYGDAVNLAARVEGRAQPGGVCVTEQVKMHLGQRVDVPLVSMGKVPLKGIVDPPELFRLDVPTARGPVALPPVAESAAAGRKLMVAAALLALVIGGAFAMSADFGAASSPPPRPAAQTAAPRPQTPAEKPQPVTPRKAAAPTAAPAAAAIDDTAREKKLAAELVTAASAEQGAEKVKLLQEAQKLDPESASIALLLKTAQRHIEEDAERDAQRAARARTRRANKTRKAVANPTPTAAPKPAAPKPTLPAAPKIQRHVVED